MMKLDHRKFIQIAVVIGFFIFPFVTSGNGATAGSPLPSGFGNKPSELISPEAVQGCYEPGVLKWHPAWKGDDLVFITPPARIQILAEKGTKMFENGQYLVRPAPGFPASIHRASYWKPVGAKTIEIIWTTGFSGLTMKLNLEGDTLKGKAETFWDFPRRGQTAPIAAPKVDCTQPAGS